jgi:hypothetical protein
MFDQNGATPNPTPEQVEEEILRRFGDARLSPADRVRRYKEEIARRGLLAHPTFESFVRARKPELLDHWYMQKQINVAQRVIDHQLLRLIVLEPTQYGKSEIWSRLLPAYYLLRNPSHRVALASYGASLAWELSEDARENYTLAGGQFRDGGKKSKLQNWRTARTRGASGGMWATGISGPSLGRGYNLGIVDDPIDPEQARSPRYLQRFQRWWPTKWLRGQRPGATAIVFIMQRLGLDDPIEWLLAREHGPTAEHWHILVLDEIRSNEPFSRYKGPRGFPETCTVEPDEREVGAILAPKFRTKKEVLRLQATAGPIVAASQRQQRPMRPTGEFWKLKWFENKVYETLPSDAHNGGWDWDTAYGEDPEVHAATAGVKSFRGLGGNDDFRIYIDDLHYDWIEFPALITLLMSKTGPHYIEKKATGKSAAQVLRTYGITAEEVPVLGDKLERAAAAQPAVSTGRVWVSRLVYNTLLYAEGQGLLRITAEALRENRGGLDVNDSFVQAVHRHLGLGGKRKKRAGVV